MTYGIRKTAPSGLEQSDKNKNAAIAGGVDSIYKLCY
jgi:hypothetical protein